MIIKSKDINKIKKVEEITSTDFMNEILISGDKGYIDCYTLYCMVEELLTAIDIVEEKKNEEIQQLEWKIADMNDHGIY